MIPSDKELIKIGLKAEIDRLGMEVEELCDNSISRSLYFAMNLKEVLDLFIDLKKRYEV